MKGWNKREREKREREVREREWRKSRRLVFAWNATGSCLEKQATVLSPTPYSVFRVPVCQDVQQRGKARLDEGPKGRKGPRRNCQAGREMGGRV